jgi:hypothetical protein
VRDRLANLDSVLTLLKEKLGTAHQFQYVPKLHWLRKFLRWLPTPTRQSPPFTLAATRLTVAKYPEIRS